MVGNGPGCCVVGPLLNSCSAVSWQPQDQEAIRQSLALPATVPCLDAIGRAMADREGAIANEVGRAWIGLRRDRTEGDHARERFNADWAAAAVFRMFWA